MTEKTQKEGQSLTKLIAENKSVEKPYLYQESGIMEGHGEIPLWLKLVALGLILWSIYYTIKYWSAG